MMLQGHFIDGLLDTAFRDNANASYSLWRYFRGMTAPVFFTVSGFIFTFLLIKSPDVGLDNPRVNKGVKRGIELLCIGYLLRMNLGGLLVGEIYDSFYLVDVLHCIGFSILGIIGIYLITSKLNRIWLPATFLAITLLLFIAEPLYSKWTYTFLPDAIANYFTKTNGSVFTVFPWFGYATFGAFVSIIFTKFKNAKHLYTIAISTAMALGLSLIFFSSDLFLAFSRFTGIQLFADIYFNNYLFIRLGDVFIAFAFFMLFRQWLTNKTLLKIGQSTLSIYVIHFIILYGSFTGLGLYQYFHHSLPPTLVIFGAIAFMIVCSFSALLYEKHKLELKAFIHKTVKNVWIRLEPSLKYAFNRTRQLLLKLFGIVKN